MIQLTKRTPTPFATAKAEVGQAVQRRGRQGPAAITRRSGTRRSPSTRATAMDAARRPRSSRRSCPSRRTCSTRGQRAAAGTDVLEAAPSAAERGAHRPRITVVGLGRPAPSSSDQGGATLVAGAARPSCARRATRRRRAFGGPWRFDHLYESAATFDEVYAPSWSGWWRRRGRGARARRLRRARVAARGRAHGGAAARGRPGRRDDRARPLVPRPGLGARSASTRWRDGVRLVDAT